MDMNQTHGLSYITEHTVLMHFTSQLKSAGMLSQQIS